MGSKKRKGRQKDAKPKGPTKNQNRVLYISIAEIAGASFGLVYQAITLFGLQQADVQASIASSLASSGATLGFDEMMTLITVLTVAQMVVALCAMATGIMGVKVSRNVDAAGAFSKLCMLAVVIAGVGAVVSIQTGTVFASFVLLGITVLLDIYAHRIAAEAGLAPAAPWKKR